MLMRLITRATLAASALLLVAAFGVPRAQAQLAGQVTSAEEGAMEGVIVSARKDGGNITVSVVSDSRNGNGWREPRKMWSQAHSDP